MRKDDIKLFLVEHVKAAAFGADVAEECVVLLYAGFLAGTHWLAEEQPRFDVPFAITFNSMISANSPPLSVKINRKYVLKERPASENRLLRKWNCFAVSEALLESIKRPNMKLQELKIKVRMTLPPMRPMTVSISTQSVMPYTSV